MPLDLMLQSLIRKQKRAVVLFLYVQSSSLVQLFLFCVRLCVCFRQTNEVTLACLFV